MRCKCKNYEGELLRLESAKATAGTNGGLCVWQYTLSLRLDTGETVTIPVSGREVELLPYE